MEGEFLFRKLLKSLRQYKKQSALSLIFIIGEVILEVVIPFITAQMVNNFRDGVQMEMIMQTGGLMAIAAVLSLVCGALAGKFSAQASAGFAGNLRADMFQKVQKFSFGNIDKFSTSSLVTRMTTDITTVQNAYMMMIRIAVRAPMMFIFAIVMAYVLGGSLATTFVIVVPILGIGLIIIGKLAMPAFRAVFKKYDKLNESIEENVRGMRVVKGFARETYEQEKFGKASDNIRKDFTKAERIVGLNSPLMELCLHFNVIFVLYFGSKIAINTHGVEVDVGQISALMT